VEEIVYRLIVTSIGVITLSILAIGCGSSGEDTASAQVTEAQFLKQMRDVCAENKSELKPKAEKWEAAHGGKEIRWEAGLKQVLGPTLKQQAEDLEALRAPKQLEKKVDRMVANLSEGAANFINDGMKADAAGFKKFQNEAEALGIKACNI
jgi:hypothetical protein